MNIGKISFSAALALAALSFSGVAKADIVAIGDSSFEDITLSGPGNGYCYQPLGTCTPGTATSSGTSAWTFTGGTGLVLQPSGFGNPSGQDGNNAAFIQGAPGSKISQVLSGFNVGDLVQFSFIAAGRTPQDGSNEITVTFDGQVIADFTPTPTGVWATYTTNQAVYDGLDSTLTFSGVTTTGDHTTFIDAVSGTATPEPSTFMMLLSAGGLMVAGWKRKAVRG